MHRLGSAFVGMLYERCGRPRPEVRTIEIQRQWGKIDILAVVNGDQAILIEDKVFTREHSDQLRRYAEQCRARPGIQDVLPLYVQTGDQSNHGAVKEAGFEVVGRADLLSFLRPFAEAGGAHPLVSDFYAHHGEVERHVRSYRSVPTLEWTARDRRWTGFFAEVQRRLGRGEWGYVPNASGGFFAFWWRPEGAADSPLYLQLEEGDLCAKIHVPEPAGRRARQEAWHRATMDADARVGAGFVRPARLREGQWMTVAVVKDYRRDSGGVLDMDATLGMIAAAEAVAREAIGIST